LLVIYARVFLVPPSFDMVLAPVFIFACMTLMETLCFLRTPLRVLGKNSTNMWLVHSFYCYYFYAFVKLVYGPGNAFVAFAVLVGISFLSAVLVDQFWKFVKTGYGKLLSVPLIKH